MVELFIDLFKLKGWDWGRSKSERWSYNKVLCFGVVVSFGVAVDFWLGLGLSQD